MGAAKADPRYVRGTVEHARYRRDAAAAKVARLDERIAELMAQRADAEEDQEEWERQLRALAASQPKGGS